MYKIFGRLLWRMDEDMHTAIYRITRFRLVQIWDRATGEIIGYRWTRIYPMIYDGRYADRKIAEIARRFEDEE